MYTEACPISITSCWRVLLLILRPIRCQYVNKQPIPQPRARIFGIERYPAEKGILESVLVKFGLVDANYVLVDLLKSDPNSALAQMFEETLALIQASPEQLTMAAIQEFWSMPPFGVPAGLYSLLAPIFTMTYHDRLSIYQQGVFRADLTEIDIEVCMQSPKNFALGWNELDESKLGVLRDLARGLSSVLEANAASEEPLEIARVLVKVGSLSPFSEDSALVR